MTATRQRIDWAAMGRASADFVGHLVGNSEALGRGAARDFDAVRRDIQSAARKARDDASQIGAAFRATPRFLRIATTAAGAVTRHRVAAARAERLWELDPDGSERALEIIEQAHRANAIAIRQMCTDLGGGMLKVGQLLSTRADLLPAAYIEELSTLQDSVPGRPFEDIAAVIAAELDLPIDDVFDAVDAEPLASASLAQVHAATLIGGREVAIKVQLPGIDDVVRSDMAALGAIARGLPDFPGIDVAMTLGEVRRFLDEELDFDLEAERMRTFRGFAAGDDRWHVPEVIRSTRRVLVMERIHGRSLGDFLAAPDCDVVERGRVLSLLVELLADQILVRGVAHGDPHPGNILIDSGNRLVLVDFGCVLEIPAPIRRAYISLAMAIMSRNRIGIASGLLAAGFTAQDQDVLIRLAELYLEVFDADLSQIDPAEQIRRAIALSRQAGTVRVPQSFVLIGRIFALTGGLLFHHQADVDLKSLLGDALRRAFTS